MKEWPVPYESVVVDTAYGQVHVIVSGPEDAPPVLLFHASGVGGWSWLYNVEELSQHYRIYAFDTLGDAVGEKDNLVGDPEKAKVLVQDIPDIRVEVLDTGHLIGAEQPEQVNALIVEFFEQAQVKRTL